MKSFFATVALASIADAKRGTCQAIALSGGANNGAWEAGVMRGFLENGDAKDFEWEVVTGVSAGSLNAMAMSGWEIGNEAEMAQWISDLWLNLHSSDVWKDWSTGRVDGWLFEGGALDNSPLLSFVQHLMAPFDGFKRKVTIASVEVNEGVYTQFDQTNTNWNDLPRAAVCSASIPGAFPPQVWKNHGVFMDGGTVYNIDLEDSIQQCLDAGYEESQIVIDALFCGAPSTPPSEPDVGHTWMNWMRARDLKHYTNNTNSISASKVAHPGIQLRYVMKQQGGIGGAAMLNFEGDFTWPLQTKGMQDAKDALAGNGSVNMADYINEWVTDEAIRAQYPTTSQYIDFKEQMQIQQN